VPLLSGKSSKVIGHNIKEMEQAGHSKAQSIAASLHNAGKDKKKEGRVPANKQKKTHKETLKGILNNK